MRRCLLIALSALGAMMILFGLDMGLRGVVVMFGIAIFVGANIGHAALHSRCRCTESRPSTRV